MTQLQAEYTVRPARLEDAPRIVVPFQQVSLRLLGEKLLTDGYFAQHMQTPGFNLETDSRTVWAADGTCAGYVEVQASPPYLRSFIWGVTHPNHNGKGIGTYLCSWALARARDFVHLAEAGKRVVAVGDAFASDADAIQLMRDQGFEIARYFFDMRIEMEAPIVVPHIPDGFSLRTMDVELDPETLYRAVDDAFRDHYGYVERPFDVGFERWKHDIMEHAHFDPDQILIAEALNPAFNAVEIAGFSVSYPDSNDPDMRGYVHQIGVRRPWRRRGLATYLLLKTFEVHRNRGARTVALGVDASNPNQAIDLYKKAGMEEFASGVATEIILRDGAPAVEEE